MSRFGERVCSSLRVQLLFWRGLPGRVWSYLRVCWTGYCRTTALHGVRYFVENRRSPWERLFWMVSVAACFFASENRIVEVYRRWDLSPDAVSVAVTSNPTWEVPFPAVSICPENLTYDIKQTDMGNNFDLVRLVCHSLQNNGGNFSSECEALLSLTTPSIDRVLTECSWNGRLEPECSRTESRTAGRFFSRVASDQGVCYTFNMLDGRAIFTEHALQYSASSDRVNANRGWSLENGYPPHAGHSTYPRRAIGTGTRSGLALVMRSRPLMHDRFKVILHNPTESPVVSGKNSAQGMPGTQGDVDVGVEAGALQKKPAYTRINYQKYFHPLPNREFSVTVTPRMTVSASSLLELPVSLRHCYFPNERLLHFFQEYTQKNCELECAANATMKNCGCALFHMPRSKGVPLCASNACFRNTAANGMDCNCLPSCTTLEYDIQVRHAPFSWSEEYRVYAGTSLERKKGQNLTRLSIFMKDTQFTSSRRSVLYGRPEFLADCGGNLVLFNGFSLVTIIEIVYHMTIRWCCDRRRTRGRDRLPTTKNKS